MTDERIPTYVAIPFLGNLEMTAKLVNQLNAGTGLVIERVLLFDNENEGGDRYETDCRELQSLMADPYVTRFFSVRGLTLTEMWNQAWMYTTVSHPDAANLAILNNDIIVESDFLFTLATALRSDDKWWAVCPDHPENARVPNQTAGEIREVHTVGVPRDYAPLGGMCGWAFMVRTETPTPMPIDEQFQWWCGDNEVVASIEAYGHKVGLVQGLKCEHLVSTTLKERRAELQPAIDKDVERYGAKRGW